MTRPKVRPFRWRSPDLFAPDDIDIRVVDGGWAAPAFFAEDICRALGIAVDAHRLRLPGGIPAIRRVYPAHPNFITDLLDDEGEPVPVYFPDTVEQLGKSMPYPYVTSFLAWFSDLCTRFPVDGDRATSSSIEKPLKAIYTGESYSVALAAKYLSRDPLIAIGRDSLFQKMRDLGWLARDHETWIPAVPQLLGGTLIRHRTRSRGRKDAYPQVRVTLTGLHALHSALGGIAPLNVDDDTQLTLVEMP